MDAKTSQSWNLTETRGPIADVILKIKAAKIPEEAKAFLTATLSKRGDAGVTVNLFCHDEKGQLMISGHISPLF